MSLLLTLLIFSGLLFYINQISKYEYYKYNNHKSSKREDPQWLLRARVLGEG